MKKILITGVNSYIGTSFKQWVSQYPDKYSVDFISLRDNSWKVRTFTGYDVVFHAAAIVHINEKDTDKYFKVNRDLTIELAKKAKQEGVDQFIFLSTMGVYGVETGFITKNSLPKPKTSYAKSKYEAEQLLIEMETNNFRVAIIRPPLVYGYGCKGNYTRLAKMATKVPIFPKLKNERSMIFIDNLSEFIRELVDSCGNGLYLPQNREYVNITELVRSIAEEHGKKLIVTGGFNWIISILTAMSGTFRKVFGTFVYEKDNGDYSVISLKESINLTEKNNVKFYRNN